MSLEELSDAVENARNDLDDTITVELDRESVHELAMLKAVLDTDETELIQRGIHVLFQATVDTAKLDFHLRNEYGVTYEEFLTGMTYDEMTGGAQYPPQDDERRYQF